MFAELWLSADLEMAVEAEVLWEVEDAELEVAVVAGEVEDAEDVRVGVAGEQYEPRQRLCMGRAHG